MNYFSENINIETNKLERTYFGAELSSNASIFSIKKKKKQAHTFGLIYLRNNN